MRKMIMVLMMVFGLSAVFADSYVAFTDKEGLVLYNNYDNTEFNTCVKSFYKNINDTLTEKEKKNSTLIIVVDDRRVIQCVWVVIDEKNPKLYIVCTGNFAKNGELIVETVEGFTVEKSLKTDPVMVGLSFIKEKVIQLNNVDKEKVVYTMVGYN